MHKLHGSRGGLEDGDQERVGGVGGTGKLASPLHHFAPEDTEVESEDKL